MSSFLPNCLILTIPKCLIDRMHSYGICMKRRNSTLKRMTFQESIRQCVARRMSQLWISENAKSPFHTSFLNAAEWLKPNTQVVRDFSHTHNMDWTSDSTAGDTQAVGDVGRMDWNSKSKSNGRRKESILFGSGMEWKPERRFLPRNELPDGPAASQTKKAKAARLICNYFSKEETCWKEAML